MDDLLQKIRAIHVTNEEIIDRVESLEEVIIYEYKYKPKQAIDDDFVLEEVIRKIKVESLLNQFEFKGTLRTDVWDVFNDKPNWKCSTWGDLKRLNKELNAIVDKFELLDKNNEKAKNELAKYLHNFEIIQTGLGELESTTISQKSRKAELQQHVNEMNALLARLKKEGVNASKNGLSFDSTILNTNQTNQLTEWYGTGWKLLYRASRDGWKSSDFHGKCDNKGETITVVKSVNNNIFGGYLKASWHSQEGYINCPNASLFTLINPYGIAPTKFNISQPSNAAYGQRDYGPIFGPGHDLLISSNAFTTNSSSNFPLSYRDTTARGSTIFTGSGSSFRVAEMEVFGKQ